MIHRGLLGGIRRWAYQNGSAGGSLRKYTMQRLLNPARTSRPIFLAGNGRSGTSMLVFHLARSWELDLYNETHSRAFDHFRLRPLPIIEKIIAASFAPVVLFKPIKDTYCSRLWLEQFPAAQILFMYRNSDDVVNSARKEFYDDRMRRDGLELAEIVPPVDRWMRDDFQDYIAAPPTRETRQLIRDLYRPGLNLESKIALHWLFQNRLFFDLTLHKEPRAMVLNYDFLVQNPELVFRRICAFLKIRYNPAMIAGIHSASLIKQPLPAIDPAVRLACERHSRRLFSVFEQQLSLLGAKRGE